MAKRKTFATMSKPERARVRAEMLGHCVMYVMAVHPEWSRAESAAAAIKLTDLALSRERAKQPKENQHVH